MRSFPRLLNIAVVLVSAKALAWGFDGHRRLAANLHLALPENHCVRQWLFAIDQDAAFQERATDPDRWRAKTLNSGQPNPGYDPDEAPRHFLQVDRANPPYSYPRERDLVQAKFGKYAESNGLVPWRVEERYAALVSAMRAGDGAALATLAAQFSHYVTDAASILHDTQRFDPKLSAMDAEGLHSRWESSMLENAARLNGLTEEAAKHLGTVGTVRPKDDTFELVLTGTVLVDGLIAADVETQGNLAELYNRTREMTARRWADALTLYGSLALSAWVDAGRPQLAGMQAMCLRDAPTEPLQFAGYPVTSAPSPAKDAGMEAFVDAGIEPTSRPSVPDAADEPASPPRGGCTSALGGLLLPLALLGLRVAARGTTRIRER